MIFYYYFKTNIWTKLFYCLLFVPPKSKKKKKIDMQKKQEITSNMRLFQVKIQDEKKFKL